MKKHNDQKIDDALKDMIDSFRLKPKLHQTKLQSLWAELMGPTIQSYTRNIRLRKSKLYITIESAPLRQELSFAKEKIKSLLNEHLGEEAIEEVFIR